MVFYDLWILENCVVDQKVAPFDIREINVSKLHSLHVEQFGNPEGYPVVYLHGGSGSGCRYF